MLSDSVLRDAIDFVLDQNVPDESFSVTVIARAIELDARPSE